MVRNLLKKRKWILETKEVNPYKLDQRRTSSGSKVGTNQVLRSLPCTPTSDTLSTMKSYSVLLLSLVALLVAPLVARGQLQSQAVGKSLVEGVPADVGMSTERLERIDRIISGAIKESRIPGAVALVARRGRIVYFKAFGQADTQAGRAMRKDDIFRIASSGAPDGRMASKAWLLMPGSTRSANVPQRIRLQFATSQDAGIERHRSDADAVDKTISHLPLRC